MSKNLQNQTHYTGMDLTGPKERATVASRIIVAGFNLADSIGDFAQSIKVPSLAGVFISSVFPIPVLKQISS